MVANDALGDTLTYTLAAVAPTLPVTDIDPATGQITVGPRTTLDARFQPDPARSWSRPPTRGVTTVANGGSTPTKR